MHRWLKIVASLLLACWLPATLHCQIEAAGLDLHWLGCHEHDETAQHCVDDNCHALEEQPYKTGNQGVTVSPPQVVAIEAFYLAALICVSENCAEPELSPARHPPPLELKVRWQFLSRAAPPARAPALHS